MATSKIAPKFTALSSEILQSIVSLVINGPSSHAHFLVGIHEKEIEVVTDNTAIESLLLVSKQASAALQAVLSNFHLPAGGIWQVKAPNIIRRLAQCSDDARWHQHVRWLSGSARFMSIFQADGGTLGELDLPNLECATDEVDLGVLWGVAHGGVDVRVRMEAMFKSWPAVVGGMTLNDFINGEYLYDA